MSFSEKPTAFSKVLSQCHDKNLFILYEGIFRCFVAPLVFLGETGDNIGNTQLYRCHINGENEGVGVCSTDGTTLEDWRQMERDVVAERVADGDANIAVVDPGALGMEANLTDLTTDGVHLSVAGAAKFGPLLAAELQK